MQGRVLFLAPQPFFRLRGMCLAQKECLEVLSKRGAGVDVLCAPGGRDVSIPGVRILRLPSLPFLREVPIGASWAKLAYGALMAPLAALLLASGRYGVVHACEESAFIAALLKPLFGFKFVYDMDEVLTQRLRAGGLVRWEPALSALRAVESWATRSADAVLTNSRETTAYARRTAGAGRVFFYDHLPPLPAPRGGGTARARARRRRALGVGTRPLIVYAGNLEEYQGVGLLLDSLPLLLDRLPEARLAVFGGERRQIEALRAKAAGLGAAGAVAFHGQRPLRVALGCMDAADVLVSTMTEEKAVPMKLYAYLSAGRPIVATALPNYEQLLSRESSVLVAPNPAALARALGDVLQNRALALSLGRGASALARRILRADGCAAALGRAYAEPRAAGAPAAPAVASLAACAER